MKKRGRMRDIMRGRKENYRRSNKRDKKGDTKEGGNKGVEDSSWYGVLHMIVC